MTQLRDYQLAAKEAVKADYATGLRRVGVSLPTGTGKTHVMASMAADVFAKGRRVVLLVHRDTLVDQTKRRLAAFIPERAIGIVKAGKNEITAPVIVASIHTLRSEARLDQLLPPNLTIVDEAHVSLSDTYLRYFDHVDAVAVNKKTGHPGRGYLAGFTATWVRSDTRGLGDVWEKISYKKSLAWAVRQGFLVEPRAIQLGGDLDMSGVRTGIDGDYMEKDLAELVMVEDLKETVIKGYANLTPGRSAVLFAPTQESARYFGAALRESGVRVAEIFAGTSITERRYNFSAFDNGAVQVLITCTALAEGWDSPKCDVALMLRPSKHPGLITQQIGRILRPWPGKQFATILDFVGVLDNADMRSIIDLSETPERIASDDTDSQSELEPKESTPDPRMVKKINGVHTVDMFAGTEARWLTTKHGVPFVNTRDHLYFVAQLNGDWAVGRCSSKSIQGGCWLIKGLTSAEALEYGSEVALEEDASIAGRKSSWRQGNQRPSAGQLQMAHGMGIDIEGMNKAQVSDAINVYRATQILANINGGS